METGTIVAPNLNGIVYKEFFPVQKGNNNFLDFIDTKNGNLLFGSTNLNGRYWNGTISFFRNFGNDRKFDLDKIELIEYLDEGVTDGKILKNENKVLIAQDSGSIKLFNIGENSFKLLKSNIEEHDDYITQLSMWDNSSFITSCADATMKLWSLSETNIICDRSYTAGHSNVVSSVSANTLDKNLFISCSYDRRALLWDNRSAEIGKMIYENEFCALTRIEWHTTKDNIVAIGNSSGDVYLVDIREPNEFIGKSSCFNRSIHNFQFNSKGLLAVCADDSKVIVLDCADNDMKTIYVDDAHLDFVRGLSWDEESLASCGWDKQILVHYL